MRSEWRGLGRYKYIYPSVGIMCLIYRALRLIFQGHQLILHIFAGVVS